LSAVANATKSFKPVNDFIDLAKSRERFAPIRLRYSDSRDGFILFAQKKIRAQSWF
jgi:hypothetical protein